MTPHIPILRHGKPYTSVTTCDILHHATGEPVATLSLANSGLIVRDIHRMDPNALARIGIVDLLAACRRAADLFMTAALPLGEGVQTFDDYLRQLSATTGLPVILCRGNAEKIRKVLAEMDEVLAGLMRGCDPAILDRGWTQREGRTLSFFRQARVFGAVLPSNSPGVHSLWLPAVAMKTPIALKPGREEPWTPGRIIAALIAAGLPAEAFGFYPSDHEGSAALLRAVDRGMIFGDTTTTRPWADDRRIEIHGTGYSKIILGDDTADDWPRYIDLMASSILANGGRSCINASAVWTPRHGRPIAEALAAKLATVRALPADHPQAALAAFANPDVAERISTLIERQLAEPGAEDVTLRLRGTPRLERIGRCAYLLPTIIWCDPAREDGPASHALANREFLFPFASVIECPTAAVPEAIGPTLVVSAVTDDAAFRARLMSCPHIDRLNLGPIPTWKISWNQPHEGNLFELLYRQRAFQIEPAA